MPSRKTSSRTKSVWHWCGYSPFAEKTCSEVWKHAKVLRQERIYLYLDSFLDENKGKYPVDLTALIRESSRRRFIAFEQEHIAYTKRVAHYRLWLITGPNGNYESLLNPTLKSTCHLLTESSKKIKEDLATISWLLNDYPHLTAKGKLDDRSFTINLSTSMDYLRSLFATIENDAKRLLSSYIGVRTPIDYYSAFKKFATLSQKINKDLSSLYDKEQNFMEKFTSIIFDQCNLKSDFLDSEKNEIRRKISILSYQLYIFPNFVMYKLNKISTPVQNWLNPPFDYDDYINNCE